MLTIYILDKHPDAVLLLLLVNLEILNWTSMYQIFSCLVVHSVLYLPIGKFILKTDKVSL